MRLRVYIKFNSESSGTIVQNSLPEVINVSDTDQLQIESSTGHRGFQLSPDYVRTVCKLDGTYAMFGAGGYIGICTRYISGVDGVFAQDEIPVIDLTLIGSNLSKLYINFDRACREYATNVLIDNYDTGLSWIVGNSDTLMSLDLSKYIDSTMYTHHIGIGILRWSKPYASAKITYIAYEYSDVFTGNTLREVTCSESTFNSQSYVQPGIVEQYANISIYDRYNRIHLLAEENMLLSGARAKIRAVNDNDEEIELGDFIVDTYDIEASDSIVHIDCKDPSDSFDQIYISNLPVVDRSIHDVLSTMFSYVPTYNWRYANTDTEAYCKKIITPNSWFKAGTLLDLLQKISTAGMLRIYWSKNTFVVARCW